jgi:sarcosine oxidase subunit alpha
MELLHTAHVPAGPGPFPTILALHGWGASAHDLLGIAPMIAGGQVLFLCPQGPTILEPAPGQRAYGWFPLTSGGEIDLASIVGARGVLEAFLEDAFEQYPIDPERLVILGFSQGGVMAYDLALGRPERFAALIALSSWLPEAIVDSLPENDDRASLATLLIHGTEDPMIAIDNAHQAGCRAVENLGLVPGFEVLAQVEAPAEAATEPVWSMPAGAGPKLRAKAFLDFQNDVKVSDVRLAAQEGYASVEHAKRYTTLGMATDQGKLSNINGLAVLADALNSPIPQVGTTTFRPPYTPVTLGALAGEARGALFKPTRKSPMDEWSDANGAQWEPVADWRRPYAYVRSGESVKDAVTREILNTRQAVGLLDASTLGKILVKGPDAGKFLDLIYTNMMSNLKSGRCRYGLMCNENGFLFDDGVVVRLDDDSFLCHTTSGGSDRVHAWMEEWLQGEWWDFKVYTANITEQFAQVAVVGPKARAVLEALGGMDVSREALPFMGWADGTLGGFAERVYRISFSGELSYEIAVPAGQGQAFWDAVLEAGSAHGIQPYGTEALHVLRAEKGFIMIGDETDGTVIPQDLGLSWAVSKKKTDFIGKRAQMRPDLIRSDRKQLVGLRTEVAMDVLPDGAHAISGDVRKSGPTPTIGHVTSSYFSPTLGHSIAMALIEGGSERMGETLRFPIDKDRVITATIVDPVFLDKEGSRQDV